MSVASAEPAEAVAEELDAAPEKSADEPPARTEPVKTAARPALPDAGKAAPKRKSSTSTTKAAASKARTVKKTK
jgi:hypothetical protein